MLTPRHTCSRPIALAKRLIYCVLIASQLITNFALASESKEQTLFLAKYTGKYSGMTINSTRKLTVYADGHYQLHSQIKNMFASIVETSQFEFEGTLLKPINYHYKRKVMGFKADENTQFKWPQNTAEYRRKNKPEKNKDHPIELGVLDPALYQLQLQREVAAGKKAFKLTFVKPSKVKTLLFHITGTDTLRVGKTDYQATRVERINVDDLKKTSIWLIPALNFQIARIVHTEEDGDSYSINLTSYEASESLTSKIYNLPVETQPSTTSQPVEKGV